MVLNNLPPRPRAVLLDFDGFLVHSMHVIHASYRHAYQCMRRPIPNDEELAKNLKGSGLKSFPAIFDKCSNRAWEYYAAHYRQTSLDKNTGVTTIDGAGNFLAILHTAKIPMVVVTNKLTEFTEAEITHFGWDKYINFVIGSGDAGAGDTDKPAPDLLYLALRKLGLSPGPDIWMCGDTNTDILAARNAGCLPILVNNKSAPVDPHIYNFSSLPKLAVATRAILRSSPAHTPLI